MFKNLFLIKKYSNPLSIEERKILENYFYYEELSSAKKDFLIKSGQYNKWSKSRVIDTIEILYELEEKISSEFCEMVEIIIT